MNSDTTESILNAEIDKLQDQWKEQLDRIESDLYHLRLDIESCEDKERRAFILYHQECMSGTSCDACRIISRIERLLETIGRPNVKGSPGGEAAPVRPVVGQRLNKKDKQMNPNDIVLIKPTDEGWLEIIKYVDETNERLRQYERLRNRMSVPVPDADGYIRGQFWSLMQFFDWTGCHAGRDIHFYDMKMPNPQDHPGRSPRVHPVVGRTDDMEVK